MSRNTNRLPLVGAHVSVAGGLHQVLPRVRAIGAEAVQIFCSNPRQWRPARYQAAEVSAFGEKLADAGIPLFVHTIYLINLASSDPEQRRRSVGALVDALGFGARAGAAGIVTHLGSHRGAGFDATRGWVVAGLMQALRTAGDQLHQPLPPLLLETSAGSRGSVGNSPEELGRLLADARMPGLGVCLDSAHLFAAGYPVHTVEGLRETLDRFAVAVGVTRIGAVHLNDSATALGAHRDRHENLWVGQIGKAGLAAWLAEPRLRNVAFLLETPGFDGNGPDRRNLWRARRLRSLVKQASVGSSPSASCEFRVTGCQSSVVSFRSPITIPQDSGIARACLCGLARRQAVGTPEGRAPRMGRVTAPRNSAGVETAQFFRGL